MCTPITTLMKPQIHFSGHCTRGPLAITPPAHISLSLQSPELWQAWGGPLGWRASPWSRSIGRRGDGERVAMSGNDLTGGQSEHLGEEPPQAMGPRHVVGGASSEGTMGGGVGRMWTCWCDLTCTPEGNDHNYCLRA